MANSAACKLAKSVVNSHWAKALLEESKACPKTTGVTATPPARAPTTAVFDGPPTALTSEKLTEIYGEEDWEATIEKVEDEDEDIEAAE